MILPNKHIPTSHSLLGVGAKVLAAVERPKTLVALWDQLREQPEVGTFARLVLALDLLYAMSAIDLVDGLITRRRT